ncbi:MAG TPA: UPF0182 family protein [Nocardioidaceae bacterium]|nr:UPF0182 family protein [Nocardioidaceae bacterium]
MSGFFDDDSEEPAHPRPRGGRVPQRSRVVIGTVVVLVALFFAVSIFTGLYTDSLWFADLGYSRVFTTVLTTRIGLFVVFGVVMGGIAAANVALAYRYRPLFHPVSNEQASLDRYREVLDPLRRWLLAGFGIVVALFAGASAAGQWRSYLLWQNQQPFGKTDPYFHKDVGFYVFSLPWLHYLVNYAMAVAILSLVVSVVVHYVYGGIRLQAKHDKLSGAAQVQISILFGLFILFKAVDYWLDRYDLNLSGGLFTGMGYTDEHASLPSKNILMFISLICALLFFANVLRRTWILPSVGLVLLVLSAILLGAIWPGIVQQFQVHPSPLDKEAPYLKRNIQVTRTAYGIADAKVTNYDAQQTLSAAQLKKDAQSIPGIRLLDPSLVSSAFQQLQQVRGYYSVPNVLDVDRYPIDGTERDVVITARELNLSGLPAEQRNWTNDHTVYTHGYGVIAAYGNQRNADNQPVTDNDGKPVWAEQDIPPHGDLTNLTPHGYQPRIYYGETSSTYAIVGKAPRGHNVELDTPAGNGASPSYNTYHGQTGVKIGGSFNQLMYALKFSEPSIFLSSRVNQNSRILYDRVPRARVQKVAPWLTVDGDSYPAVVNGRVKWILDCYTTTDNYPNSERQSLSDMTSDSLNPRPRYATLPTDDINYMRNSVKAVVDAYSGTVKLYAWKPDPILEAWSQAFPDVITPRGKIPPALKAHMRYPEDLFKVQRDILATYHVLSPSAFFSASDKWTVPVDPENPSQKQPPYRLSVRTPTGGNEPVFSLTSVYVPNKRQNLAAFVSVDSDPTRSDYGQIRILRLPSNTQTPGPSQIANNFGQDPDIQNKLVAFTKANSKAIYGNLLTLPVGNGLLYVQPLYAERNSGSGRYPALRYVLASFGNDVGIGTTLTGALDDVLGISSSSGQPTSNNPPSNNNPPPGTGENVPQDVQTLLKQAEHQFAVAQKALQSGDLAGYQAAQQKARSLVSQALKLAGKSPSPSAGSSPNPGG